MRHKEKFWNKKSIIWNFAITDLKLRYKNSILGFFWTFLEPLLILVVLYLVFTNIFKNTIEFFPLYLLLGIIMWQLISRGTQFSLNATLSKSGILSQIYIPLSIPPLSASITALIMLSLEMMVFGIFLVVFQFVPPITALFFPLLVILGFFLVLGISLPLSVLNVRFRDVQFIWGVILHAGFFLHPIFYKIEMLPEIAQDVLKFIPSVQILIMGRDMMLYENIPSTYDVLITIISTMIIFGIGFLIFKKFSKNLVEEL